jgi:hypothetical protein
LELAHCHFYPHAMVRASYVTKLKVKGWEVYFIHEGAMVRV